MTMLFQDYKLYKKRRDITNKPDIIIFKPVYKIRPTPDMVGIIPIFI